MLRIIRGTRLCYRSPKLVRTDWAIVYSLFWCYSEHLIYLQFFYICSWIIFKFYQGLFLRLSAKASRFFFMRITFSCHLTPVYYVIKSSILLQAVPFSQNSNFAGMQATFGNCRRNRGLSYVRTHKIWKITVRAPLRRILHNADHVFTIVCLFLLAVLLYAFGSFCQLPSIVLCMWLYIWLKRFFSPSG